MLSTTTNSYGIIIRDGILDRMRLLNFFRNGGFRKFSRSKRLQYQPEDLPFAGCYLIDEQMTSDGDANTGNIRFLHSLQLGLFVAIKNNDSDDTEDKLDEAHWALVTGLLTDDYLTNGLLEPRPYRTLPVVIEGWTRARRRNISGSVGLNNSTPYGEMNWDLSVSFRSHWEPVIVDELQLIHMTTRHSEIDANAPVAPVVSEWDLTTEPVAPVSTWDAGSKRPPNDPYGADKK